MPTISGIEIKKAPYTKRQKKLIVNRIFKPITLANAEDEFMALRRALCNVDKDFSPFSRVGNKTVDFFTRPMRWDTDGQKGMSFYDFLYNKSEFIKKPFIEKFLRESNQDEEGTLQRIFSMYYGSVNIFRPLIAMEFYCMFNPKSVLDFTMGWGGRLIAAAALNLPKYIGIDMNPDLEQPYREMVAFLKDKTSTEIILKFQNALSVDYSKLVYDMVFTSPPYYNVEIYTGTHRITKDEWDNNFYRPIIEKTYAGLKKGGWYCLNIPEEVYERIAKAVLGKATRSVPFRKNVRGIKGGKETYGEMVYCWNKK